MAVSHYSAEFRVDDAGAHVSKVTWPARFDVEGADEVQAVDAGRQFFRTGLDSFEKKIWLIDLVTSCNRPSQIFAAFPCEGY